MAHVSVLRGITESVTLHSHGVILDEPKSKDVESVTYSTNTSTSNQPKDGFVENDDFIPLVTPSEISLSPEQNLVLNRVKEGRSVFFTGSAGQLHSSC